MSEITPERIAELRKQYPMVWSRNRDHHPFGHFAYSTLDINELLDALESSRAEVDKTLGRLTDAKAQLAGAEAEARMFGQESTRLRAEVQHLQQERDAAIDERNAWRSGDQDSRIEADRLRGEVQRLTEEARRLREIEVSDEVRGLLAAHGSEGTVLVCGEFANGREFVEKYRVARRSDAGRVEAPTLDADSMHPLIDWTENHRVRMQGTAERVNAWFRSRLSPSPQPATGAVELESDDWRRAGLTPQQMWEEIQEIRELVGCDGTHGSPRDAVARKLDALRSSPQPSVDVVVVPREEWKHVTALARIMANHPRIHNDRFLQMECEADPHLFALHRIGRLDALRSSTNQKPTLVVGDCVTSEYRNDLGGFVRHSFSGAMPDAIIAQSWDYRTPIVDGSLDGMTRYSEDQVSMEDCLKAAERRKLDADHDAQDAGEGSTAPQTDRGEATP